MSDVGKSRGIRVPRILFKLIREKRVRVNRRCHHGIVHPPLFNGQQTVVFPTH
jgi:hypothetical protein